MEFEYNAERRFIDQLPNDHIVKIAYDILNKFTNAQTLKFFKLIEENLTRLYDENPKNINPTNNIIRKENGSRKFIESGYNFSTHKYATALSKLKNFKFEIFGGAVRDVLLGLQPQDIDVRFKNGSAITDFIKFLSDNNYIVDNPYNVSSLSFLNPEKTYDTFKSITVTTLQNVEITFDLSTQTLFDNTDVKTTDFTVNGLAIDSNGWLISKIEKEASISQIINDIRRKRLLWCGSDTVPFVKRKSTDPHQFVLTTGKFVERLNKMIKKNFTLDESQLCSIQCNNCEQNINSMKLDCGHFYCIECLIKEYKKVEDDNKKIYIDNINKNFEIEWKKKSYVLIDEFNHSSINVENIVKKYLSLVDDHYDEHQKKIKMLPAETKMSQVNCRCSKCTNLIVIKPSQTKFVSMKDTD